MIVNGSLQDALGSKVWGQDWKSLDLSVSRGMLAINEGNRDADAATVAHWMSLSAALIVTLLPLETDGEVHTPDELLDGYPEGGVLQVTVNRYERDRRNRAAAIALHGSACRVCKVDMGERYGTPALGLIELHHTTPVSELGPDYQIDLRKDLVPLCPNCHAVAHRRRPPYTMDELASLLR